MLATVLEHPFPGYTKLEHQQRMHPVSGVSSTSTFLSLSLSLSLSR
jgi:hypothetical protein